MRNCYEQCRGQFFTDEGPVTRDGKPTHLVFCPEGLAGGCKGPDCEEVAALNSVAGRKHGAPRQEKPLIISQTLGRLTRGWGIPKVLAREGLGSENVIFRK